MASIIGIVANTATGPNTVFARLTMTCLISDSTTSRGVRVTANEAHDSAPACLAASSDTSPLIRPVTTAAGQPTRPASSPLSDTLVTDIKPPFQKEGPKSFLSLPAELRNEVYRLALSVQPTPEKDSPPLLLPFSPPDAEPPSIPVAGPQRPSHRRHQVWHTYRRHTHCTHCAHCIHAPSGAPYPETVEMYRMQRKLHIPALLRTHPLIKAEASGIVYLHQDIVIEVNSDALVDFRRWARRVLSPSHRGMLFSNPGITFRLLGHITAIDLDVLVDWLVKDVPAAIEWRFELSGCCRECSLRGKLARKAEECMNRFNSLRVLETAEQGRLVEIKRELAVLRKLMLVGRQ